MASKLATGFITATLAFTLAACGGGGGYSASPYMAPPTGVASASMSSGAITAFGSVFVNGHEFKTSNATVIDDDTDDVLSNNIVGNNPLEVGMVVGVIPMSASTNANPEAQEIRVSPLARGFVDLSNTSNSTLTVMGQTVQISSATAFSDGRACARSVVPAGVTPCTAIIGQAGLAVSGTTPGTFVAVHGYLFGASSTAQPQIIATLVKALDYKTPVPATSTTLAIPGSVFKAEGQVTSPATAPNSGSITLGTLTANLTGTPATVCVDGGTHRPINCSTLAAGNIVSVMSNAAPASGAITATLARLRHVVPQTPGNRVEIEGRVSSVGSASFVVRGITINQPASLGLTLPAVGDKVEILATVDANGTSVTAISREDHEVELNNKYLFESDLAAAPVTVITPATATTPAATKYTISVFGQTITINAATELADRTSIGATFNISNVQTYLTPGATPKHLLISAYADSSGALTATSVAIIRQTGLVAVSGKVDSGSIVTAITTMSSLKVHGVNVIYNGVTHPAVAAGNYAIARGTLSSAGPIDTTSATTPGAGLRIFSGGDMHDHGFDD